jgi:hypothetical protein
MTWKTIDSAPADRCFIATLRVYNSFDNSFSHHDMHVVAIDEDTGDICSDLDQGWSLKDYEYWAELPAPPEYGD